MGVSRLLELLKGRFSAFKLNFALRGMEAYRICNCTMILSRDPLLKQNSYFQFVTDRKASFLGTLILSHLFQKRLDNLFTYSTSYY